MSTPEIWLIYFLITVLSGIPFFMISDKVSPWFLKLIRDVAGLIFISAIGVTILMGFILTYEYFFPDRKSNSGLYSEDYEDCERDYYRGGCM